MAASSSAAPDWPCPPTNYYVDHPGGWRTRDWFTSRNGESCFPNGSHTHLVSRCVRVRGGSRADIVYRVATLWLQVVWDSCTRGGH